MLKSILSQINLNWEHKLILLSKSIYKKLIQRTPIILFYPAIVYEQSKNGA